jgi:hypothetical protein
LLKKKTCVILGLQRPHLAAQNAAGRKGEEARIQKKKKMEMDGIVSKGGGGWEARTKTAFELAGSLGGGG